jgi:hypothetical protein
MRGFTDRVILWRILSGIAAAKSVHFLKENVFLKGTFSKKSAPRVTVDDG